MALEIIRTVAKFTYKTDDDKTATVTIQNADPAPESEDMLAAANAFITNNTIFEKKYTTLTSAKIVQTSEDEYTG